MTRRVRFGIVLFAPALLTGLLLAACDMKSDKERVDDGEAITSFVLKTKGGGTVDCYMVEWYKGGGPTCDWVGYHQARDKRP